MLLCAPARFMILSTATFQILTSEKGVGDILCGTKYFLRVSWTTIAMRFWSSIFWRLHRWRDSRIATSFVAILFYYIGFVICFRSVFLCCFSTFISCHWSRLGPFHFGLAGWKVASGCLFMCRRCAVRCSFFHFSANKWIKIEIEYVMLIRLSCAAADSRFHSNCCEWIEFEMLHHWTTRAAKSINPRCEIILQQHTGCWRWTQKREAELLHRGVWNSFRTSQLSREPMPTHLPTPNTWKTKSNAIRINRKFSIWIEWRRKKQRKLARIHTFFIRRKSIHSYWCRWKVQTGPFVPFVSEIALPTHNE